MSTRKEFKIKIRGFYDRINCQVKINLNRVMCKNVVKLAQLIGVNVQICITSRQLGIRTEYLRDNIPCDKIPTYICVPERRVMIKSRGIYSSNYLYFIPRVDGLCALRSVKLPAPLIQLICLSPHKVDRSCLIIWVHQKQ